MSTLRTNALEGMDAKNSITIVAGAGNITTTNVQEGLCKAWLYHNEGTTINDSFAVSSLSDDGTGAYTSNYSVTFTNTTHVTIHCSNQYHQTDQGQTTTSATTQHRGSDNSAADTGRTKVLEMGDLA